MFNKKAFSFLLVISLLILGLAACNKTDNNNETTGNTTETSKTEDKGDNKEDSNSDSKPSSDKKIAVLYYQYSDTYISTVRKEVNKLFEGYNVLEYDGQNDQAKQNDQIDTAIQKGVDLLLVNIVDVGAAPTVIDKAKSANVPVIFFNREPSDGNVYASYDKARFVGTRIQEAGEIQGDLIAKYWKEGGHDRNQNGKLDYVLLHGGIDNAEAVARSEYAVKTLEESGIEVNKIAEQIANWDGGQAQQAMEAWLAKDADNIDVVISNNDTMAIGALTALQSAGLNKPDQEEKFDIAKFVGVFGVDAVEDAKVAIKKGTMTGTVKQDPELMAKAIKALSVNALEGKEFIEGTEYEYDDSKIAVRIPYLPYTAE